MALDVTHDVRMVDLAEVLGAGGTHLAQEWSNHGQMSGDASRRQAAFSLQIIAEVCEYLILPSDPRQLCRRNHTCVTQHRQEPLQRRAIASIDGLLRGSVTEKLIDHTFIDVGQNGAAAWHPF